MYEFIFYTILIIAAIGGAKYLSDKLCIWVAAKQLRKHILSRDDLNPISKAIFYGKAKDIIINYKEQHKDEILRTLNETMGVQLKDI